MASVTPPAHNKIATPEAEVATIGGLWRLSDATGVPACTLFRALNEDEGANAERIG